VLEVAVRLAPDDSNSLINLGHVYLAQGQLGRAIPALEYAVKLAPKAEDARFYLIESLTRAGQLTRARTQVDAWLQQRPDAPQALYWSTAVGLMAGDRVRAVSAYRRLQTLDAKLAADVQRRSRMPGTLPIINLPD